MKQTRQKAHKGYALKEIKDKFLPNREIADLNKERNEWNDFLQQQIDLYRQRKGGKA